MAVTIGLIRENAPHENRVALVPAHVPDLTKRGVRVVIERGAGLSAGYPDDRYEEKGVTLADDRGEVIAEADMLVAIRAGAANTASGAEDLRILREGASVVALLDPWQPDPAFDCMIERNQRAFALELLPRITRAQSMDVLSSQANLAGYRAVLLASVALPRMFPMLMTAAGTVVPARVLVIGVGVAGLQAIATARRLGAVVSAYDIRPAVREQVESLGARFLAIDLAADDAETGGGYAREMDAEFYRKQQEMLAVAIAENDVVITTAAIPGKQAPVLVTAEMARAMTPGSVIVDLAVERGGNCELSKPGETTVDTGNGSITIIGPTNAASGLAYHASQLFSKNITAFLATILSDGDLQIDRTDEIILNTMILENGGSPHGEIADRLGVPHREGKE